MAKLLVRNKETGETRPMTKNSFDLVGHKRGFEILGPYVEEKNEVSDPVRDEIARRKAEKAAVKEQEQQETEENPEPEKPKRGRKPKESAE